MALRLVMMEQARSSMSFGQDQFLEEYPGVFLMAVGMVAAQESAHSPEQQQGLRASKTLEVPKIELDNTLSMGSGERLGHAMRDHPLAGCTFFLPSATPTRLIVGRKVDCDLTVPDVSVSDEHCELQLDESGTLLVTDLGSTNGTRINLARLEPNVAMALEDEDVLTVGRYSFQYFAAASLFEALQVLDEAD